MKNLIILSTFLVILGISAFIISCDDFLSPTIEIFNEVKTPVNIEQEHKQEQKKEQKQENINQQQEFLGYIVN
jgi:hypothetical protein